MNCLYLHIPFCRSKCLYCSFTSYPGLATLYDRYTAALHREIRMNRSEIEGPLDTLFLGGGTPTVLKPAHLISMLDCCREVFGFAADPEISLEANPGTVSRKGLDELRHAGFNRISFGVQSFDDRELGVLGRLHKGSEAEQAIDDARRAGFVNLSLDLMYGLPGQTVSHWRSSLERALVLAPEHVSAYQLSVEDGTVFADWAVQGRLELPDEDSVLAMDELSRDLFRAGGLIQYEISNFARPGYSCRHNCNYWHNDDYLACGAGGVSYLRGVRAKRTVDPLRYCQSVETGNLLIEESETLEREAAFRETVIIGLRLIDGVSEARLEERYRLSFDDVYGELLDGLVNQGLLQRENRRILLSETGRRLANQEMARLV